MGIKTDPIEHINPNDNRNQNVRNSYDIQAGKIELWLMMQKNLLTTEKKQTKINIKISIRRQHYEIIF